jgi:hypothetical protein
VSLVTAKCAGCGGSHDIGWKCPLGLVEFIRRYIEPSAYYQPVHNALNDLLATVEALEREHEKARVEIDSAGYVGWTVADTIKEMRADIAERDRAGRALAGALATVKRLFSGRCDLARAGVDDALALARPLHWLDEQEHGDG